MKSEKHHRDSCCCCRNHLRAQTPPSRMKIPEVRQLRHSSAQLSCGDIIDNFLLPTVRKQDIIKVTEQLIEAISNGDFESYTWVTQIRGLSPESRSYFGSLSTPTGKCVTQLWRRSSPRLSGIWWKAWTSIAFILKTVSSCAVEGFPRLCEFWPLTVSTLIWTLQCGLKTVNQSTPPSWTLTSTWLAMRPRALLTSEWRNTLTPTGHLAPPNQRRPECGTAATGSGRSSISTAQAPRPHSPSENRLKCYKLKHCIITDAP